MGPSTSVRRPSVLGAESGQALIEAALAIPLVLVIAFGVVMAGRVAHAQVAVQSVVREAGRTLAVAPSASDGLSTAEANARAVASGHGLAADRLGVTLDAGTFARGGTVRAEARYRVSLADLPLLGRIEVTVTGHSEQRIEQYRSRVEVLP